MRRKRTKKQRANAGMQRSYAVKPKTIAFLRYGGKCVACRSSRDLTAHHLNKTRYRRDRSGRLHPIIDTFVGIVPLCRACHDLWHIVARTGRTFEEWLGVPLSSREAA